MSLLLKALKQAEAANGVKPGTDKSASGTPSEGDLELEPLATPGMAQGREWVEPPGLLFGSSGLTPASRRAPVFRWPRLSLVPLTALLAALVALGYGLYLYFALKPPVAVAPSPAQRRPHPSRQPVPPRSSPRLPHCLPRLCRKRPPRPS